MEGGWAIIKFYWHPNTFGNPTGAVGFLSAVELVSSFEFEFGRSDVRMKQLPHTVRIFFLFRRLQRQTTILLHGEVAIFKFFCANYYFWKIVVFSQKIFVRVQKVRRRLDFFRPKQTTESCGEAIPQYLINWFFFIWKHRVSIQLVPVHLKAFIGPYFSHSTSQLIPGGQLGPGETRGNEAITRITAINGSLAIGVLTQNNDSKVLLW